MSITRRNLLLGAAAVVATGAAVRATLSTAADGAPVFEGGIEGVAINGYDPVAYFTRGEPVEGSPDHTFRWRGTTWRFASTANRDTFAAAPERYAPQYGGFCAFAMAQGQRIKTDPAAFSIVDDKLYLNYDRQIRKRWEADRDDLIEAADERWPKVGG